MEHFDEGVYASNLWFDAGHGYQYPQRHFYAPPMVPWLIEWTMILSGQISGSLAIWPSLVAGVLTIAVVWWQARHLFGTNGAHIAAIFAALSSTHSLLSRTALTDAVLLLWFVLAIGLFDRGCRTLRWKCFVGAGFATGFAWLTKYNGWLPLFVVTAGVLAHLLLNPLGRRYAKRLLLGLLLSGAIAFAIWMPYLLSLQSQGGYVAVNANHRKYVVGVQGWPDSLTRQIANLRYVGGLANVDLLAVVCGAVGAICIARHQFKTSKPASRLEDLHDDQSTPASARIDAVADPTSKVSYWILLSWYCGLAVMTPLYTPYPRLLLPLLAGSWLCTAGLLTALASWFVKAGGERPQTESLVTSWKSKLALGTLLVAVAFASYRFARLWDDRRGLEQVAETIQHDIGLATDNSPVSQPRVVYVYGEPALFFHLQALGMTPVGPVQTVKLTAGKANGEPVPTFLAVGPHALRDPTFQMEWKSNESRFELVASYRYRPSTLVALDNYTPRQLEAGVSAEEVRLYRIK